MKAILQTMGTVFSIILSYFALSVGENNHYMNVAINSPMDLLEVGLTFSTIILMAITGISYYKSRLENEGIPYFLYAAVGLAHAVIAPLAFTIAGMKIDFGQYWWVVLLGIIGLIIWSESKNSIRN